MTVDQMRMEIMYYYRNSPSFKAKVQKMPDNQVIAIYKRMVSQGKLVG